jgi:hypothetical protein
LINNLQMCEQKRIGIMRARILITGIILVAMTVVTSGMERRSASLERDLVMEEWMTAPFMVEEEMGLENWMVTPFEAGLQEDALWLENWMAVPFEVVDEKELTLEKWMSEPFELVDNNEEPLECWMVTPFEVSEVCASL